MRNHLVLPFMRHSTTPCHQKTNYTASLNFLHFLTNIYFFIPVILLILMYYLKQMKRVYLLALVLLGFLLMPTATFACGDHSGKNSCSKETSANMEKMDCCKNGDHSKNKNNHNCNGKCGHSNCVTSPSPFSAAFFDIQFNSKDFAFSEKKQNYFNSKTNLSSGFYSLWLIPKIS